MNGLPDALHTPVWPLMQCGSLAAVPMVALALRIGGHDGAAARVAIGGVAAWTLAKGIEACGRPGPTRRARRHHPGRAATARADGASPRVTPPVATVLAAGAASVVPGFRPLLVGIAATVSLSRLYVGAHLPLDVIGGAGLGLAVHATVQIVAPEQPG